MLSGVDTIKATITSEQCGGVDFTRTLPQNLLVDDRHRLDTTYNQNGTIKGHKYTLLGGCDKWTTSTLEIGIYSNCVTLYKGSLAKWQMGNNVVPMSRRNIKSAIDLLSNETNLDWNKAKITRLDWAVNVITKHKPSMYFGYLSALPRFERLEQQYGLRYEQVWVKMALYDKVRECNGVVPELYKGVNILRCELRYLRDIGSRVGFDTLGSLCNGEDVMKLNNRLWEYKSINKKSEYIMNCKGIETPGDIISLLAAIGVESQGGVDKVVEWMKEQQRLGNSKFDKQFISRTKDKLKRISQDDLFVKSDLMNELDIKMYQATHI